MQIKYRLGKFSTFALVSLVAGSTIAVAPLQTQKAQAAKKDPACVVIDQGFTPFFGDSSYSDKDVFGVSVGFVIQNKTKKNVRFNALRINAYSGSGKLLVSEDAIGSRTLAARDSLFNGYEMETTETVKSIKIVVSCSPTTERVTKIQSAGSGIVDQADASSDSYKIKGVFYNRQKTTDFGNITYVLRDSSNRIVAGGWTNSPGVVPRGTDVAWKTWSKLFTDFPDGTFPELKVESSISSN